MAAYSTATFTRPGAGIAAYQQNQVNHASPGELLLKVYDIGIGACTRGDAKQAKAAVVELINSLNFTYSTIAVGLLRLYNYCLDLLRESKFEETKHVLSELRATWAQALGMQS